MSMPHDVGVGETFCKVNGLDSCAPTYIKRLLRLCLVEWDQVKFVLEKAVK